MNIFQRCVIVAILLFIKSERVAVLARGLNVNGSAWVTGPPGFETVLDLA